MDDLLWSVAGYGASQMLEVQATDSIAVRIHAA